MKIFQVEHISKEGYVPLTKFNQSIITVGKVIKNTEPIGVFIYFRFLIPYVKRINNPYARGTVDAICTKIFRMRYLYEPRLEYAFIDIPDVSTLCNEYQPPIIERVLEEDGIFFVGEHDDYLERGFTEEQIQNIRVARSGLLQLLRKHEGSKGVFY